jgi:hypothetical protein
MDQIVCIDDSNKPPDFPASKWIKKDGIYTILEVVKMSMMGGVLGVSVEEIDTSNNFPYTHFRLSRFRPVTPDDLDGLEIEEVNELLKEVENFEVH